MGLIISEPPDWGYYANNLKTTIAAASFGSAVTAGASNVKGTAASLLTITQDVEFIRIGFGGFSANGVETSTLADILIDPAGGTSWQVLVPNLFAGNTFLPNISSGDVNGIRWYDLPLFIPSGSAIGCQAATNRAATLAGEVMLFVAGANRNPGSWWSARSAEAIGITTADSSGTAHTAGNSSAFSSWTNFGSTLSRDAKAFVFAAQGEGDSAFTALSYLFEVGVASNALAWPIQVGMNTSEYSLPLIGTTTSLKSLASGTQMMVRGKCSGTAQAIDLGIWALS